MTETTKPKTTRARKPKEIVLPPSSPMAPAVKVDDGLILDALRLGMEEHATELAGYFETVLRERMRAAFDRVIADTEGEALAAIERIESLTVGLRAAYVQAVPEVPAETKPVRVDKPRALVVGLLPIQQEEIDSYFGDLIRFTFVKDATTTRTMNIARRSDAVFVMTGFVSHSQSKPLSRLGSYRPVNGSVSALKVAVNDWLDTLTD